MTFIKKISLLVLLITTANEINAQQFYKWELQKGDSLFFASNWIKAKQVYEAALKDTVAGAISWVRLGFSNYHLKNYDASLTAYNKALSLKPSPAVLPVLYSRIAKVYAVSNQKNKALVALDSAFKNGYLQFGELDTLNDFNSIRNEEAFKKIRDKIYNTAWPCMNDGHHREFDFWIGEWDVYQTGTKAPVVGHSLIQMIAGGCAILENWDSPGSTGKSINFIDPVTDKWKQSWSGSYAQGTQEFVNGEYKDSAMRFTYETKGANGEKILGRFVFYNQGSRQVRQFNETSADEGKTWITSYDFTYVRK